MAVYPITLTSDDNDTFMVTSSAFPELATFGESEAAAKAQAVEAILEAIAARMSGGEDVPAPGDHARRDGGATVAVPLNVEAKVWLYRCLIAAGINRAELARRLGWHRPQVDRLFDLDHQSKNEQLEAAFAALGYQVGLTVSAA
ncbi:type II toxin-antitoxin system HicB family antitoxin [Caulobacter segnis]|uniref:HicB family protein n=1 Tax=Caulobacter segnis TaxID=88688 RepID=A0A2W5VH16_9CAUL|nr:hypothetical protein [Caulobacter segnis]PZR37193.1 MAG: HicB family protein [Caulobacter segnis]